MGCLEKIRSVYPEGCTVQLLYSTEEINNPLCVKFNIDTCIIVAKQNDIFFPTTCS